MSLSNIEIINSYTMYANREMQELLYELDTPD